MAYCSKDTKVRDQQRTIDAQKESLIKYCMRHRFTLEPDCKLEIFKKALTKGDIFKFTT